MVLAVLVSVVVDGLKYANRGGAIIQVQDVFLRLACRATQKNFDFVLVPRTNFLFDLLVKIKRRCGPRATTTTVTTATTSISTSGSGLSTPTVFSSGLRGPTTSSALSNGVSSSAFGRHAENNEQLDMIKLLYHVRRETEMENIQDIPV